MDTNTKDCVYREGKNEQEALQAACDALNTTPNQVEYEVVESGRGGMLGFLKGRQVKIKVWEKSAAQRMVAEIVKELFAKMQLNVEVNVSRGEDAYEINLETSDSDGLLIGRGGDTLKALQHLISRMVGHQDENARVRVDVAGYRKRRHEQLCRKARDLAERSLSTGRDIMTEPLPADERRIVHMALADDTRVETRAVGEGQIKRVAVCSGSGRGDRSRGNRRPSSRQDRPDNGSGRGDRHDRGNRGDRSRSPRSNRGESGGGYNRDRSDSGDRGGRGRSRSARDDDRPRRDNRESRPPRERSESSRGKGQNQDRDRRERTPRRREKPRQERSAQTPANQTDETRPVTPAKSRNNESRPVKQPAVKESYFNIPATVEAKEIEPIEEKGGENAPLTFGRRRKPGRGRR